MKLMIFLLFIFHIPITERVNGEATKTSDILRSATASAGDETPKERQRRQSRERTASRSRSRSPLSGNTNSEYDDLNKYPRKIRHPSSSSSSHAAFQQSMHEYNRETNTDSDNRGKDRKSPLSDVGAKRQSASDRSPSPLLHSRRSKSASPSRVEQVEAVARHAAEHAIRVAGNTSQQYSPPSSPPKSISPLAFMEKSRKPSSLGSTIHPISTSMTTNAPNSTTTSKFMSNLPLLPNKDSSNSTGLNALLSNGMGDTIVSRCPPILPTNPLDSMSPGNPAGLTGALAAIQAGQSSIQQV